MLQIEFPFLWLSTTFFEFLHDCIKIFNWIEGFYLVSSRDDRRVIKLSITAMIYTIFSGKANKER
jgi:hypothetical protein